VEAEAAVVEGDSASLAELYALMSPIGEIPLRQGIAMTEALNQQGTVGDGAEKAERFLDACRAAG
jgi:predicted ATP-dependent protease